MRVLTTELKKLLGNKIYLLIIVSVFILNAYLLLRTANNNETTPSDYKVIYSQLEGFSEREKLQWFDDRLNEFSGEHHYNWTVLNELREECANVAGYSDYLASIESQKKSMTSVSIFAKPGTFNYRCIMKTPSAYKNVQDVVPVFAVSKGINLATDNNFTDVLCGFIVLFAVVSLMISDREQGMSGLLFSLKHGRGYLMCSKLMALAITILCAVTLMYCENLLVSKYLYGLGDLSRPIQSLNGFIGCNLKISVAQYLVLYILFKWLAVFAIGAVLSLIAVTTKNTVSFYGISAIVVIIERVLYSVIHPLSIYSIFKFINLAAFTKVNQIFCNYNNINFWEYPVPLIPASTGALLLILAIGSLLSAFLYSKKRNLEFKKIGIKLNIGNVRKIQPAMYYMLYKSLIQQKGVIVIIIFIFLSAFQSSAFIKKYNIQDVYYQYYANKLDGKTDSETDAFMISEQQRFDDLNEKLNELMQSSNGISSEVNEIHNKLAPQMGFVLIKERYDQIKGVPDTQIFYDTGYNRMFGNTGYDDDMKYALTAMLLCIFLVSPLIANDNKYRMQSIINSTQSGKRKYLKRNITATIIFAVFSALLWIIPYMVKIKQYYGLCGLNAPIHSMTEMLDFPLDMKLWEYILLVFVLRTVFIILSALVMLWISSRSKNNTIAILVNFAVFALPIIIYLFGAKAMVNIGMNPMLSVNTVFNDFSLVQLGVAFVVLYIILINRIHTLKS